MTRDGCRTAARLGSLEAILSGTTTVADHHFLNRGSELAAGTIDGMLEAGIRAVVARTVMDTGEGLPSGIKEEPAAGLDSVNELLQSYRAPIDAGELVLMTGPNTPGINASEAACKETADFAIERGLRRSAHVAEYRAVRQSVLDTYGVDGVVRWLDKVGALGPDLLAVHLVQVDDDEVQLLADRGVVASHNPFSNLFCGSDIAPVDEMLRHGVSVGLGTDEAANNNGQGIFDVVRISRLLQRSRPDPFAISPEMALRMATIDGARGLGLDHFIGSIEEGKLADLIVLWREEPHMVPLLRALPHLAAFARGSDVQTVIIGGRVVMRDREVLTVDRKGILRAAQAAGADLVARLD